jgi:hypothetical protein
MLVPVALLRAVVATVLIAFGGYRLWRHASAHGAGIMGLPWVSVMPVDVSAGVDHGEHGPHTSHLTAASAGAWVGAVALVTHSVAYLTVMTLVAWVVYRRLGLAFLRVAWFNLNWRWAGALVITGVIVFFRSI